MTWKASLAVPSWASVIVRGEWFSTCQLRVLEKYFLSGSPGSTNSFWLHLFLTSQSIPSPTWNFCSPVIWFLSCCLLFESYLMTLLLQELKHFFSADAEFFQKIECREKSIFFLLLLSLLLLFLLLSWALLLIRWVCNEPGTMPTICCNFSCNPPNSPFNITPIW